MSLHSFTSRPVVVFDLETQETFEDVGGRDHTDKLKISVCGVWDYRDNTMISYRENQLQNWLGKLQQTALLVGFNSKHFDQIVLQKYFPNFDLSTLKHLDILQSVHSVLGFRLKLQSLVETTLGEGKSGSGLDAIEYFRAGDYASLEHYCLDDVRLTRDLLEYGARHGQVWYMEGDKFRSVSVDWHLWVPGFERTHTVSEMFEIAAREGKKLRVIALEVPNEKNATPVRPEWTLDVLSLRDGVAKVFVHELGKERALPVMRVLASELSEESAVVQQSLF